MNVSPSTARIAVKASFLTKELVAERLRELGSGLLKEPWRSKWSVDKPSTGYCYLVSEALFHYLEERTFPYVINLGPSGTHWFLNSKATGLIDFTAEQFAFPVPYGWARRATFYKGTYPTKRGLISERGYRMAACLRLV